MFENREHAGELLAMKLLLELQLVKPLVLGIARGGAVVGARVASEIHSPFDVLVVKKLGAPFNPELAIGAVGPKETVYFDEELIKEFGIKKKDLQELVSEKQKEVRILEIVLRGKKTPIPISGKTVVLIDDGVATGATVLVALEYVRKQKAKQVVLAVPVISKTTLEHIKQLFDKTIALEVVDDFESVGQFYKTFPQVENEEVRKLLC